MPIDWSLTLVTAVRQVKDFFGLFSSHTLAGIPLDWIVRPAILGGFYLLLRLRTSGSRAAAVCVSILLVSEFLELICTQHFPRLDAPGWDDLADVLTGVTGIAAAEGIRRLRRARSTAGPE
jgi:hypothetical protein